MDTIQFVEAVREMRSLQKEWQYSGFNSKGNIAQAKVERQVDAFLKDWDKPEATKIGAENS